MEPAIVKNGQELVTRPPVRGFESLTRLGRLRRLRGVAAEALQHFDLPQHRVSLQADSFNTVFRVTCAGAAYLLRVGPARRIHDTGEASAEHNWTATLGERGLRVPQIVLSSAGAPSVSVAVPGVPGQRECTLLTWRSGRPLTRLLEENDLAALAELCAEIHSASPPERQRPSGVLDSRNILHFNIPSLVDDAPGTDGQPFEKHNHAPSPPSRLYGATRRNHQR